MAAAKFSLSLPKQWEDWCSSLLGFWLCISPWVLQFDLEPTATRTAVITGILLVFVERMTLYFYRTGRMDQRHNRSVAGSKPLGSEYQCSDS